MARKDNLKKKAQSKAAKRQPKKLEGADIVYHREYQRLIRKMKNIESGHEVILQAVKEAFKDYEDIVIPPPAIDKRRKIEHEVAILHLSDVHVGKVTETFNSLVCFDRVMHLVDTAIEITRRRKAFAKIEECRVYVTGDIIEGEQLFPHQAHIIDKPVIDQILYASQILMNVVTKLLTEFRYVKVIAVPGNHGRTGHKYSTAHPKSNWDTICNEIAATRLLGCEMFPRKRYAKRLSYDVRHEWYALDYVYNWGNLLVHGHQIKGGAFGIPWYGHGKKMAGWADIFRDSQGRVYVWDFMFSGHFHTASKTTFNSRVMLSNGTVVSDDPYALEELAAAGEPCQRFCFFNESHGLISDDVIYLDDRKRPARLRGIAGLDMG